MIIILLSVVEYPWGFQNIHPKIFFAKCGLIHQNVNLIVGLNFFAAASILHVFYTHICVSNLPYTLSRNISSCTYTYIIMHIYKRVLKDLRWCIRHYSSVDSEKSARLNKFKLSAGPRFDSDRKHVNSNQYWFEHIDPQPRLLNYCF